VTENRRKKLLSRTRAQKDHGYMRLHRKKSDQSRSRSEP
jgi:hypothetical protein